MSFEVVNRREQKRKEKEEQKRAKKNSKYQKKQRKQVQKTQAASANKYSYVNKNKIIGLILVLVGLLFIIASVVVICEVTIKRQLSYGTWISIATGVIGITCMIVGSIQLKSRSVYGR